MNEDILQYADPVQPKTPTTELPDINDFAIPLDPTADQAKSHLILATDSNPDNVAKSIGLSKKLGVAQPAVEQDTETFAQIDQLNRNREIVASNPKLQAWIAKHPLNAKVAADDVENLGAIEQALNFTKGTGLAIASAAPKFSEGAWGVGRAVADLLPDFIGDPLAEDFAARAARLNVTATGMMPQAENILSASWYSGMQSLGLNVLQLPLGIGGKMAPVLTAMGLTTGGQSYTEARDKGLGVPAALTFGASQGVIEAGTEMIGMPALFGMLKPGQFMTKALEYTWKEQFGEQIATHLQDLNEWAALHPEKTLQDYLDERPDAAIQTALATLFATGGQVTIMKGVEKAVNRLSGQAAMAQRAEQSAQALEKLDELVKASKVRGRDTDSFEQFIQTASEDGPVQDVFISAETLAQSGLAEKLAEVSPAVEQQFEQALVTGGDIRIPVDEYLTKIAGTEYNQGLIDNLKTEPEGMSRAEAKQFMDTQTETLKADVERVMAEKQVDDTFQASTDAVKADIKAQLDTAARFTGPVHEAYASMVGNFYAVTAAKIGITPQELYARYPLKIQAEDVTGGQVLEHQDVLTFEQFAARNKASRQDIGEAALHRSSENKSPNVHRRQVEAQAEADRQLILRRADLQKEYDQLVADGKIRPPTYKEQTIDTANGHPDNEATQAARRIAEKRGWDWKNQNVLTQTGLDFTTNQAYGNNQGGQNVQERTQAVGGRNGIGQQAGQEPRTIGGGSAKQGWSDATRARRKDGPAKLYRGSNLALQPEHFSLDALGKASANPSSGLGVWLTTGQSEANTYGPTVEEFHLDIRNPKVYKAEDLPGFDSVEEAHTFREKLRKAGHDGIAVIFKHLGKPETHFVAFDAEQVIVPQQVYAQSGIDTNQTEAQYNLFDETKTEKDISQDRGANRDGEISAQNRVIRAAKTIQFKETEAEPGIYYVTAKLEKVGTRDLPSKITTPQEAANATAYLSRNAVEHFDAIVTDKKGKTLAVIGSFKGAATQTSVYPSTIVQELAKIKDAANVWASHNHPSGVTELSSSDIQLSKTIGELLRGSGVIYRGLLVVADGKFASTENDNGSTEKYIGPTVKAPIVERVTDGQPLYDMTITSPKAAKVIIPTIAKKQPGIVFLSAQHSPVAFIPVIPEEMRELRTSGRLMRLFNAAASTGASAAMIANPDNTFPITAANNLASALVAMDIRALDEISYSSENTENAISEIERGTFESRNVFFQKDKQDRGSFNPSTSTITLLKNADLSTFLHESGHFFLEVQFDLTARGDIPAEMAKDTQTLLNWFGVKDLTEWGNLTFEEKRSYHEKFARGFEAYLFEGKAPNLEMQSIFQRFRAWMLNVYKELKSLNVELTDEVRGVFDRMVATDEQIALAEQGRSMMPLFSEQTKSGLSAEAFAAYQKLGRQATDEAIQNLQVKGMRDMQWLHKARGREIARLQKESASLRHEAQIDARKEIMSQPIYRAWQFLTNKITPDDKVIPLRPPKSQPGAIDETIDSLFVAIAKLGGLNKDEAIATWGSDAADKPLSGLFGKPVWKKDGRSLDSMAEALGQYGYLEKDENGKVDLREFEEKFAAEMRGDTQFSNAYEPDFTADMKAGDQIPNPEAMTAGRFDIDELNHMDLPQEIVELVKARRMTDSNGLHPDLVAEMFGFNSGDELMRTLAKVRTPQEAISNLTDQQMLEQHGELSTQDAIEREADKAIHNKLRAKFIATEFNALAKAMSATEKVGTNKKGQPVMRPILPRAAKDFASSVINKLKIRDILPGQYTRAEARSAKASEKANKKGDIATAAAEKRNQLINNYLAKAAYDAHDEVDKGIKYLNRITSDTALKNMRGDAKAQMLAILDRFDIRKSLSLKEIDKQQSISEWVESEAERLAAPIPQLSDAVRNEAIRTHYKNLTLEEFNGLMDSIKQLEHMARREHKAYITIRNMTLQEEVANAVAEIRDAWPKAFDAEGKAILDTPLTHQYAMTVGRRLSKSLQHMNAEFVPMEELVDQLTAGKFGLLHDSLFGRLSNASDRKSIMAGEIRNRLKPFYDAYSFQEKRDFSRKVVGDTGMTRENLLMLALYYGNVEGRQRLASQGFNDQQVLHRINYLTEKDINLAEAIWSLNDDYIWPMYQALNERTQGKAPPKVEALPMQVNGRDIKGGYVKLVYDSAFDETTRRRDSMEDAMAMIGGRVNVSAKTEQGSSIERVKGLSKMPLLELRAMSQAVNEHMHDISYREAVADTVRVLRTQEMRDAIKAVAGDPVYTELMSKINEVAARQRDPSGLVLKGLDIARRNTVVVLMSGIKTALINYSGFIPALNRVNAGSLVKNIAKVHSWRMKEMIQFAMDNSEYMRERNQQFTSDLQHEMASLTVKNRILPEMGTFLILMRMVDQVTSTSVWLAAYEDANVKFKDHDRAVEYANNVTRSTQGGGRDVDTSKIMTRFGPWSKPFTMFYSYFNRQLALLVRQGVIGKQAWQSGRRAEAVGKFAAAYITIVVLPALINDIASGRCDKAIEGDEGWTRCISKAIAMNMSGYIPIVRDFVPYVWGKLDEAEPNYGLRMTPTSAYLEGVGSGIASTVDVVEGEGDEKDTKAIFMGLAYSFGLPGKLMWDVTAGTESVINKDAPPQSILFGPPKK